MFSTLALSFSPIPARLRSNFSLGKISGERMRRAKRRRNAREKSREKCTNPLARTLGRKAMGLARAFFIVTRSRQTRRISFHDRRRVCMYTYGRLRVRAGENFIYVNLCGDESRFTRAEIRSSSARRRRFIERLCEGAENSSRSYLRSSKIT